MNDRYRKFRAALCRMLAPGFLACACHAAATTELLPPEVTDVRPPGQGFEAAARLEVDFAATDEIFLGLLFRPLTHFLADDEEVRLWLHVESTASLFVAKLRFYRGADFVDLPVVVTAGDFGQWTCVTVNLREAVPEEKQPILHEITGCYFFTHRPWLDEGHFFDVYLASVQGAKSSDPL
jgi:hypothetical protein